MQAWIDAVQRGDRQSFAILVRHFAPMAYAVAYERLRDHYMAEDAVQEAFTEAYLHLDKLREPEAFPGWLKTIVLRQCTRISRRKHHPMVPLDKTDALTGPWDNPEEIAEIRELYSMLHDSVAGLSPPLQTAIRLFYWHGYSLKEIAQLSHTSVPALKKRLHDARRKLKRALPVADFIHMFRHLQGGESAMLHIVNGDSVGEKLKQGVVHGDILVWREIYTVGPLFAEPAAPDNRKARARELERAMGIPTDTYTAGCEAQEQALASFRDYDEIVLWFEHDVYDQTMLCYLLQWFHRRTEKLPRLSLLCIGEFPGVKLFRGLGQLSVEQMKTLSGTWRDITHEELALGAAVWDAFAASEPTRLAQLLEQDTSALPFVQEAIEAHLSRFPAEADGLGSVERATLTYVRKGVSRPVELFRAVSDDLHRLGMGDLEFWYRLSTMTDGPAPLLRKECAAAFPRFDRESPEFISGCRFSLTPLGEQVAAAKQDWLALHEMDVWHGGVHLRRPLPLWRYDPIKRTVVRT